MARKTQQTHALARVVRQPGPPTSRQEAEERISGSTPQTLPEVRQTRRGRAIRAVEGESKEDRFSRLAQLRTSNALRAIRLIGQLSAPQYSWTDSQVAQILSELQLCMEDTAAKFRRSSRASKVEEKFHLVGPAQQPRAA